jgi:hypothetical protein
MTMLPMNQDRPTADNRIYMCFRIRPVQEWTFLTIAAQKCSLLLRYRSELASDVDYEALRRVVFACYILERSVFFK